MATQLTTKQNEIKTLILESRNQINSLLQDESKAKRFMAAAFHVANDTSLERCSSRSILNAIIGVAMLNLEIDKNLGHAYLINYKGNAQLQIGYKGMIQLLFRAGWVIKAFPIFTCDTFEISNDGWDNKIRYIPNIDEQDEGNDEWCFKELRGVYVAARNSITGDEFSRFASKKLIEKLRLLSPNQNIGEYTKENDKQLLLAGLPVGIWKTFYPDMACAKAIKKLAKILPIGDNRVQIGLGIDDATDSGQIIDYAATMQEGTLIEQGKQINTNEATIDITATVENLTRRIQEATSKADFDLIQPEITKLPAAQVTQLRKVWSDRKKALKEKPVKAKEYVVNEITNWSQVIADADSLDALEAISNTMDEVERIDWLDELEAKQAQLGD